MLGSNLREFLRHRDPHKNPGTDPLVGELGEVFSSRKVSAVYFGLTINHLFFKFVGLQYCRFIKKNVAVVAVNLIVGLLPPLSSADHGDLVQYRINTNR